MLVWGWRVPFLVAILTLVAAIALRYNMPESSEVSAAGSHDAASVNESARDHCVSSVECAHATLN